MKRCNRCKVEKEADQFIHGKHRCLECYRKYQVYYQANREREIARATRHLNKDRNHTNFVKRNSIRKNPISYILWRTKAKCKKEGIPFDLSHADILIPEFCPVLGIKLHIGDGMANGASPSVDRTNPKLGYVKGNIAVISNRANTIKSDATVEEIERVLQYVKRIL